MDTEKIIERDDGSKYYFLNNLKHREDGPAEILANGNITYFYKGEVHREDGPAVIFKNGYKEWRQHNELHREDGPAVENTDGSFEFYKKGMKIESKTMYWTELFKRGKITEEKLFKELL